MSRGKFIVIEGGEGAGKGECVTFLARVLRDRGKKVITTREPGGSSFAEEIRNLIFSEAARVHHPDPLTQLNLFAAARIEHTIQTIRPALKKGRIVLCDRGFPSTFAYQIAGEDRRDLEPHFRFIDQMSRGATWDPSKNTWSGALVPDLTVFLDVDPEVGLERADRRTTGNHFDEKELAFHRRVRDGYYEILSVVRHVIIDANQPMETVRKEALQLVSAFLRSDA